MEPDEFRTWLHTHGYTHASFAGICLVSPRTVESWTNGKRGVPRLLPVVCKLLERIHGQDKETDR